MGDKHVIGVLNYLTVCLHECKPQGWRCGTVCLTSMYKDWQVGMDFKSNISTTLKIIVYRFISQTVSVL